MSVTTPDPTSHDDPPVIAGRDAPHFRVQPVFVPDGPVTTYPPTRKSHTGLWLAGILVLLLGVGVMGLLEIQRYRSLPSTCRAAVLDLVKTRMASVDAAVSSTSSTIQVEAHLTDVEISEPIYDGPFTATVPAKFSAQMNAGIFSRDTSVPLQCNASFNGWSWQTSVVNAVR